MKKLIPVIVLIVVVLAGAFLFLSKGAKDNGALILPGEIKKEKGESEEAFTGKLLDAMAKGIPFKCEYKMNETTGTSYVKGKRYYGEISSEGRTGYIIMEDKCMWTWDKEKMQGVKMCLEKSPFDADSQKEAQGAGSQVTEGEYSCKPAVFADSIFTPPANVNFMDMDQNFGAQE